MHLLLVTGLLVLLFIASPSLNCSHVFILPADSAHAGNMSRYSGVGNVGRQHYYKLCFPCITSPIFYAHK